MTPGIYATITASDLKGTFSVNESMACVPGGFVQAPGSGTNFACLATGSSTVNTDYNFFAWSPNVALPVAGATYPMFGTYLISNYAHNVWTDNPDSDCAPSSPNCLTNPGGASWAVYPNVSQDDAGPGSPCSITYDEMTIVDTPPTMDRPDGGIEYCVRARFSCTGLVGSSSGQPFDIANGFVVAVAGQ